MSFLFGKSKKHQNTALPAATRDISSSHGQGSLIPTANGLGGRDPEKARGGPPTQTPTPGSSVNNSLNSLQAPTNTSSPEPKTLRERSDSELHVSLFPLGHSCCQIEAYMSKSGCRGTLQPSRLILRSRILEQQVQIHEARRTLHILGHSAD
jgi:hypothetical protein